MAAGPTNELSQFRDFVATCLEKGEQLTPEGALDLWRLKHPMPGESEQSLDEIRRALADLDAGNIGVIFAEFDRRIRQQYGLLDT